MKRYVWFVILQLASLGTGCGEQQLGERLNDLEVQNGPIASRVRDRFATSAESVHRVGWRFDYEGEQQLPPLTMRDIQYAHSASRNCVATQTCEPIALLSPEAMEYLDEIWIYTENRANEQGFAADPQPIVMAGFASIDVSQTISDLIDGIAGAYDAVDTKVSGAVEWMQDAATCLTELGKRVFPGELQLTLSADQFVYDCRVKCLASSVQATIAWCLDDPGKFVGYDPDDVAQIMGGHITEYCAQINGEHLEHGGCRF